MNKKLFWGLIVIVLLLGTTFVFKMIQDHGEIQELKKVLSEAEKMLEDRNKTNGHYHADGSWHEGTHAEHAKGDEITNKANSTPKLVDYTFKLPEFKSDLPNELPAEYPTDSEIQ